MLSSRKAHWLRKCHKHPRTTQKPTRKKNQIIVKVGKVKGATGYQVLYGTQKSLNAREVKTSKGAGKLRIRISGLKSKKVYYTCVRPYKKYGGKIYTGISSSLKKIG